jgi:tetratricopeptide (TPR) repeat protein
MNRASHLWVALAAYLALGNPAFAQARDTALQPTACEGPAQTILALQTPTTIIDSDQAGRSAALCGYSWSAANLLERTLRERPSPAARFNLAAAYVNTGRFDVAADLYRSAAADGEFSTLVLDRVDSSQQRYTRVNVTDEANRRLRALALRPTLAKPAPVISLKTTEGYAAIMAAIASVHIDDSEALYLDDLTDAR